MPCQTERFVRFATSTKGKGGDDMSPKNDGRIGGGSSNIGAGSGG